MVSWIWIPERYHHKAQRIPFQQFSPWSTRISAVHISPSWSTSPSPRGYPLPNQRCFYSNLQHLPVVPHDFDLFFETYQCTKPVWSWFGWCCCDSVMDLLQGPCVSTESFHVYCKIGEFIHNVAFDVMQDFESWHIPVSNILRSLYRATNPLTHACLVPLKMITLEVKVLVHIARRNASWLTWSRALQPVVEDTYQAILLYLFSVQSNHCSFHVFFFQRLVNACGRLGCTKRHWLQPSFWICSFVFCCGS